MRAETDPGGAPAGRLAGGRLLAWAAVAVLTVDMLFLTGTSNFLASPQARILNQLILVAVGLVVAVGVARRRIDARSPLLLPGLAWVVVTAIAALASQRTPISREALAVLLVAAPAYLAVRAVLWSDWLRPRVDRLLVVATLVFLGAYLLQAASQWLQWWSVMGPSVPPLRPGDVGLTIGTVNAVALHIELLAPVAAWLAWRRMGSRRLAALVAVLAMVALVITGSRGAWLGAAIAAVVAGGLAWLRAGRPVPGAGDRRRVAGLGVVVVLVIVVGVVASPVLLTRLLAGDAGRFELWSAAWSMFTGSPVAGTGPGTFPQLRPLTPISEANLAVLTTSHNSVLQVLVDAGILGIAAAGLLLAAVARLAVRAIGRPDARIPGGLAVVVIASLVAMLVHSLLDTQFHVPAVVLLVFLLVARLDPPQADGAPEAAGATMPDAAAVPVAGRPARRGPALAAATLGLVAAGAVLLVPVDLAMVRAQLGNLALAHGDAPAALEDFRAAAGLQDLAPYRLGEGLAAQRAGDAPGAAAAFQAAERIAAFTFATANRAAAAAASERGPLLDAIEAAGSYDATALVNAAAMREPDDPGQAASDLALVMAQVPTLVASTPPPDVFSAATWASAQAQAIDLVGATDPASASAMARSAGLDAVADRYRAQVTDAGETAALDLLDAAVGGGTVDVGVARALLRSTEASPAVVGILWLTGFEGKSQPLIDAVAAVSVPLYFATPPPLMELVVGGSPAADYSMRLPRYPMASDFRQGPSRPYAAGLLTIEPVYRPK